MIRAALLAALALLLAACSRGPGLDRLAPGEEGRVSEVRSGDTLVLDSGLVVRLAGVEAPKGGRPYEDQSRAALQRLVAGKRVKVLYGGERRDRYDRALAQAKVVGGDWLQGALLKAGAVRERTWADNRAMAGPMLEAEAYARNRRLGLWALPDYRVLLPGETVGKDGFQIVEGRVRRLGQNADAVQLLFDHGFSAEIEVKALPDFRTAGRAPETLVGKAVRMRGPIRFGPDGPQMTLDHPEQVALLKDLR